MVPSSTVSSSVSSVAGLCSKQIISHYTNTVEGVVGTYKLKAAVSIAQQFCATVFTVCHCVMFLLSSHSYSDYVLL